MIQAQFCFISMRISIFMVQICDRPVSNLFLVGVSLSLASASLLIKKVEVKVKISHKDTRRCTKKNKEEKLTEAKNHEDERGRAPGI